jgi:flagellar basal-body rod protein FlgC
MDPYAITASALTAQRLRMNVISGNLANANTTRQADGSRGAYRRKNVIFTPIGQDDNAAKKFTGHRSSSGDLGLRGGGGVSLTADGRPYLQAGVSHNASIGEGVQVVEVTDDTDVPMRRVFDPSHPDSDDDGYVEMPNVNPVNEMIDLISASRAYQANVTAFQSYKSMQQATIEQL